MTKVEEQTGKTIFLAMMKAAQGLSFSDLFILRSAWKGKLAFEELPDHLRTAFAALGGVR